MRYKLLDSYVLDQIGDQVSWVRIFTEQMKVMVGRGVYRDDVLVLLFPQSVETITDLDGLRSSFALDGLPEWNKTKYLIHMGSANQGYPVQEAIATADGRHLDRDETFAIVDRIESVFK